MAQPFGEHPGLAGSRRCDHPSRARSVRHRGKLVDRQIRRRRGRTGDHDQRPRPSIPHGRSTAPATSWTTNGRARPAVDPRRRAVGQDDIAGLLARLPGAEAAALRPHHQIGGPVLASYALAHTRWWSRSNQGSYAAPSVHGSATSDVGSRKRPGSTASSITTASRAPAPVESMHGRRRILQGCVAHDHHVRSGPGCGDRTPGHDDHAATERGRSWEATLNTVCRAYDTGRSRAPKRVRRTPAELRVQTVRFGTAHAAHSPGGSGRCDGWPVQRRSKVGRATRTPKRTSSSLAMSWKCRPVVGSSNI